MPGIGGMFPAPFPTLAFQDYQRSFQVPFMVGLFLSDARDYPNRGKIIVLTYSLVAFLVWMLCTDRTVIRWTPSLLWNCAI